MGIILENAILVDIDPIKVERGSLRLDGARIAERGESVTAQPGDDRIDCGGAVVMPGMVNGHTHLYSALAAGMPLLPQNPANFLEILKFIWWRLDRALDPASIEMSARIGALDAVRCGTTTLIDHHASPNEIIGSLDLMEEGLARVGVRGVLCYEVTDRNGREGREAGLTETRRHLAQCRARNSDGAEDHQFASLVGAHASFTLQDETLEALATIATRYDAGVHIHIAEDGCDEVMTLRDFGAPLVERLTKFGIVRPGTIFGHGIHLDANSIAAVNASPITLAHNPRSNMNNSVGYSQVGKYTVPIQLGTDGIGGDMFTEARFAWFKSCDAGAGLTPADIIAMLAGSARRASEALGVTLGKLEQGAAADVIVTNYRPATPLTTDNFPAHFIFAMGSQHVKSVIANGEWIMRDRAIKTLDEAETRSQSREVTAQMWERLEKIKP